ALRCSVGATHRSTCTRVQLSFLRTRCHFFFNDTATTEIYPLPLHDALPISIPLPGRWKPEVPLMLPKAGVFAHVRRSEEHTSELQSHHDLVCRLLLEKN